MGTIIAENRHNYCVFCETSPLTTECQESVIAFVSLRVACHMIYWEIAGDMTSNAAVEAVRLACFAIIKLGV